MSKSYVIAHRPKKGPDKYWGIHKDGISRIDSAQTEAKKFAATKPDHRVEIWCDIITVEKVERIQ